VFLDALFFFFDDGDALVHRLRADYAGPAASARPGAPLVSAIQHRPQPVDQAQPGQPAEYTKAGGNQRQQQQRRAGETSRRASASPSIPPSIRREPAAARLSACTGEPLRARCWPATAPQIPRPTPTMPAVEDAAETQIVIARPYALQHEQHPPPRGKAKQVKQHIREIRAQYRGIACQRAAGAMRPRRIGTS